MRIKGGVAVLVERFLSTHKVSSSIPREVQKNIQGPLLGHIISSVRPTSRWTRAISSLFKRENVITRELCQVSWMRNTLVRKAKTQRWEWPSRTLINKHKMSTFGLSFFSQKKTILLINQLLAKLEFSDDFWKNAELKSN